MHFGAGDNTISQDDRQSKSQMIIFGRFYYVFQMIAQLYSWVCCEPRPEFPDPYCFTFGGDSWEENSKTFQSNQIKTTKYNLVNFLPKSILTQYQRLANLYFLIVAVIASIPEVTPLNPALIWTPLTLVLFISILKELYEDYSRFSTDRTVNEQKEVTVVRGAKLQKIKWKQLVVGDVCRIHEQELFPADLLLISSSDKDGVAFIETATLDGEQTSKVRYAFHELNLLFGEQKISSLSGRFEGEAPSAALAQFRGAVEVGKHRLTISDSGQLLFRGARLKRTKWVWGVVVYTGQCSKIMMNGQSFVSKLSTVERKLNYLLIVMLVVQLAACLLMASLSTAKELEMRDSQSYVIWRKNFSKSKLFVMNFLLFFIEYSSLIPVSLIVSIEIAKTVQSYFIDFDQLMFSSWRQRKAYARIAALNEELGQIEYVFCDKTGTLTKNQLKFHTAVIGNQFYHFNHSPDPNTYSCDRLAADVALMHRQTEFLSEEIIIGSDDVCMEITDYARLMEEYFMCLLVCNNVSAVEDEAKGVVYESESPDELAIIEMASNFGFRFLKRDKNSILVEIHRQLEHIEIVETFPFTSDRKRMSVIIKWRGSYLLYIKGADNVILDRAVRSNLYIQGSVDRLCQNGLRTLLVGVRLINTEKIQEFTACLRRASIESREAVMEEYGKQFQKEVTILGATGLLDELQDEVPETLRDLQRADIRVWMLTGDKLETAIEVGKACNLIRNDYELILFKKSSKEISKSIRQCFIRVSESVKKHALVVQGSVLTEIFNDEELQKEFAKLTVYFTSVICCRMLPVQKSQAVRMIKLHLQKICLAIGDGGNDVSMIKQANIGVGVYGEEGMSAVQASDYAIPEFKMIWRLLFVHGRWNYMRICEMILYFAFKSILFTVPRFLFSFMNAYSGQPIYDDFYIALYNVVFTALPLLVRALFEQDVNYVRRLTVEEEERSMALTGEARYLPKGYGINEGMKKLFPKIYFVGQKNQIFNLKECFIWTFEAILTGVCLFFIVEQVFASSSFRAEGYNSNLQLISITIYTSIIFLDTLKLCMQVRHWTKLLCLTILFLSIAPYLSFIWILNYRFKRPVQGILIVYFTSIKTYFAILAIILILVSINGVMIYVRFHSHKILSKMATALEEDDEMVSFVSSKCEKDSKGTRYSEDYIKPRSSNAIDKI